MDVSFGKRQRCQKWQEGNVSRSVQRQYASRPTQTKWNQHLHTLDTACWECRINCEDYYIDKKHVLHTGQLLSAGWPLLPAGHCHRRQTPINWPSNKAITFTHTRVVGLGRTRVEIHDSQHSSTCFPWDLNKILWSILYLSNGVPSEWE